MASGIQGPLLPPNLNNFQSNVQSFGNVGAFGGHNVFQVLANVNMLLSNIQMPQPYQSRPIFSYQCQPAVVTYYVQQPPYQPPALQQRQIMPMPPAISYYPTYPPLPPAPPIMNRPVYPMPNAMPRLPPPSQQLSPQFSPQITQPAVPKPPIMGQQGPGKPLPIAASPKPAPSPEAPKPQEAKPAPEGRAAPQPTKEVAITEGGMYPDLSEYMTPEAKTTSAPQEKAQPVAPAPPQTSSPQEGTQKTSVPPQAPSLDGLNDFINQKKTGKKPEAKKPEPTLQLQGGSKTSAPPKAPSLDGLNDFINQKKAGKKPTLKSEGQAPPPPPAPEIKTGKPGDIPQPPPMEDFNAFVSNRGKNAKPKVENEPVKQQSPKPQEKEVKNSSGLLFTDSDLENAKTKLKPSSQRKVPPKEENKNTSRVGPHGISLDDLKKGQKALKKASVPEKTEKTENKKEADTGSPLWDVVSKNMEARRSAMFGSDNIDENGNIIDEGNAGDDSKWDD